MSEHTEQAAVCDWLDHYYPNVLYWANINGAWLAGSRQQRIMQVNKLKAEGYLPGVADLTIAEPRGGYHGMFLEMKTITGSLSENQEWFLAQVRERGYYAVTAYGYDEAVQYLTDYLARKE